MRSLSTAVQETRDPRRIRKKVPQPPDRQAIPIVAKRASCKSSIAGPSPETAFTMGWIGLFLGEMLTDSALTFDR